MNVTLNGNEQRLPDGATVADAVSAVSEGAAAKKGIAVAVNGEVVARSQWDEVVLSESDRVEVLRAVGGG